MHASAAVIVRAHGIVFHRMLCVVVRVLILGITFCYLKVVYLAVAPVRLVTFEEAQDCLDQALAPLSLPQGCFAEMDMCNMWW